MTFGEKEALTTLLIRASSWSLCGESCAPSQSCCQAQTQVRSARIDSIFLVKGAIFGQVGGVGGCWVVVAARGVALLKEYAGKPTQKANSLCWIARGHRWRFCTTTPYRAQPYTRARKLATLHLHFTPPPAALAGTSRTLPTSAASFSVSTALMVSLNTAQDKQLHRTP